jgi:hypothetical protein
MTTIQRVLSAACLLAATSAGAGQPTAYEALRAISGKEGDAVLRRVTEVSGQKGTPQPLVWRAVVADPAARGGIREYEVSGGRILSERTPVGRSAGSAAASALPMADLKLDSDGAFRVANAEAWKARVGFDSASYTLRKEDETAGPVWTVELFDNAARAIGKIRISGVDGRVLSTSGMGDRPPGPTTWPKSETTPENGPGGFLDRANRTLDKTGRSMRDGSIRAAGTVQYWFTGRQTLGAPEPGVPERDDFD